MQQPLVSILMPVHNAAPYLRASIESVSAQSYANWELIVVDDHSDDTSLSVAQEFTSEPRITVLAGSNHGASACRNQAFLASKGDFVKFLDADDILSETHIEQQVPAVIENPMQVACSAWTRFEHAIPDRAILTPDSSWRTLEPLDWFYLNFEHGHKMMQCGMFLLPRKLLAKTGLWDETLSLIDDFEFFSRVLPQAQLIKFTEEAILFYRSNVHNSLGSSRSIKAADSAIRSLRAGFASILEHEDSPRMRQLAANMFQDWAYILYPEHPSVSRLAELEASAYGGASIGYPGGKTQKLLSYLIGWKLAARILR